MTKKKILFAGIAALILIVIYSWSNSEDESQNLFTEVVSGDLNVAVMTSGELQAINSIKISAPGSMRSVGIRQVTISKMMDEGSTVKEGDVVAELDKSELYTKLKTALDEFQKAESKCLQSRIDTAISLSKDRETLRTMEFNLMEKQIKLEQSIYEPPATVRLVEMELDQSKLKATKEKETYKLNQRKAKAKMQEAEADLRISKGNMDKFESAISDFTILAPAEGMLNYVKTWSGEKIKTGTQISSWNPAVAELPDLTEMISMTYINEVDIRKVKKGLMAEVTLDAFPDKRFKGEVMDVANMGEEIPGSDAKVFAVEIRLENVDNEIRPGMTTGNQIFADKKEKVLQLPLETLFSEGDSVFFVYKTAGLGYDKQEIKKGISNENYYEVISGLKEGETVYLSEPKGASEKEIERLENEIN